MQHEVRKYLFDIVQAANDIREFTHDLTSAEYIEDVKTQAAVERKFEIIGEALNRVKRFQECNQPRLRCRRSGDRLGCHSEPPACIKTRG